MPEKVQAGVARARAGQVVQSEVDMLLPGGWKRYRFYLRPVFDAARRVIGIVPEALEIPRPGA
jgi:hypothetical protein